MNKSSEKTAKRERRRGRVRARLSGTSSRPRLSVFKSNKHLFVQLIDDENGLTLASVFSKKAGLPGTVPGAKETGLLIAKAAKEKKLKKAVFDRGGYSYTGVIKALADGAREGGLEF